MTRLLLALALGGAVAFPAFAETGESMTCHDFSMMDEAGRTAAMEPKAGGMMAAGGDGGMMAAGDGGGMMAAGGATAEAEAACTAHPEMTVGEAMKAMH